MTGAEAAHAAIGVWLSQTPGALLLGEAVGRGDSLLGRPSGLLARFGETRVVDLPAVDGMLVGYAAGAALAGLSVALDLPDTSCLHGAFPILSALAAAEGVAPCVLLVPLDDAGPLLACAATGASLVVPTDGSAVGTDIAAALGRPGPTIVAVPREALGVAQRPLEAVDRPAVLLCAVGAGGPAARAATATLHAQGVSARLVETSRLMPTPAMDWLPHLQHCGRLVVVHGGDGALAEIVRQAATDAAFEYLEAPSTCAASADDAVAAARASLSW